jgi:hypothetical protein
MFWGRVERRGTFPNRQALLTGDSEWILGRDFDKDLNRCYGASGVPTNYIMEF